MIVENCPKCGGTHIGSYKCPFTDAEAKKYLARQCHPDPRDPDYSRPGIFTHHNCSRRKDGTDLSRCPTPDRPGNCGYPQARND